MGDREQGAVGRLVAVLTVVSGLAVISAATVVESTGSPDRLAAARDDPAPSTTSATTTSATATSAPEPESGPEPGPTVEPASEPESEPASEPEPESGADSEPTVEPETEPRRGRLVIHGVGDTNFDPSYIPNLATFGYEYAFDGLGRLFERDDLTVVNLECAPSDLGARVPKQFNFRCPPESLPVARANGVDVANLANNHVLDYGVEAMLDGRINVEAAGVAPVGVGADLDEATTPALLDIDGWRVAVLGMGGVVPAGWWLATDERPGMASGDDLDQMAAAVAAAAAQADLVVVSIHWGRELVTEPDPGDRARAEAMIDAGADVIFGHHSHRLGQLEWIDGTPVFWTLGNFVWPRLSDAGSTTAVARVVIDPDGGVEACLLPAFITTSGRPELTGPAPCGPAAPGWPDPAPRPAQNKLS